MLKEDQFHVRALRDEFRKMLGPDILSQLDRPKLPETPHSQGWALRGPFTNTVLVDGRLVNIGDNANFVVLKALRKASPDPVPYDDLLQLLREEGVVMTTGTLAYRLRDLKSCLRQPRFSPIGRRPGVGPWYRDPKGRVEFGNP